MGCQRDCNEDETLGYVRLNLAEGQYFLHFIRVKGMKGIFGWQDENANKIFSDRDWPAPQDIYQRKWPDTADPKPSMGETHYTMAFTFVSADEYEYVMTLRDKNGNELRKVKNCTYGKEASTDRCFEPLTVNRVG